MSLNSTVHNVVPYYLVAVGIRIYFRHFFAVHHEPMLTFKIKSVWKLLCLVDAIMS
jgi:hypothetical protein